MTARPRSHAVRRLALPVLALLLAAVAPALAATAARGTCRQDARTAATLGALRTALAAERFVAYQPTALRVYDGRSTRVDPASLRADLAALAPRFNALITYTARDGMEALPEIAAALGFRTLIVGVWNPRDPAELDAALAQARAHPRLVKGLSLGNETVLGRRLTFAELATLAAQVHARAPTLPLSTTEPFHLYLQPPARPALAQLDFLLANVHPVFQPWFRAAPDANAADFVVRVVDDLGQDYCGPILVKETGVPTAPASAGYTPARQASFYRELQTRFRPTRDRAFAYFVAFDAPWRVHDAHPVPGSHPEEAWWGLYDEQRRPKPVVGVIPPLPGVGASR